MAADIFESYEVTMVSGLILGLALWHLTGRLEWIIFPLIVRGIGVLSSISAHTSFARPRAERDAMAAIFRGFLSSAAISAALFFLAGFIYLSGLLSSEAGGEFRQQSARACCSRSSSIA